MPTYDYECLDCGHRFELFQMMSEKPKRKCPYCKKNKAKRLIGSGMGVIFKGSGFYETDYKRKEPSAGKKNPQEKKESPQDTTTPKIADSKSDNKKSENSKNNKDTKTDSK